MSGKRLEQRKSQFQTSWGGSVSIQAISQHVAGEMGAAADKSNRMSAMGMGDGSAFVTDQSAHSR